MTVTVNGTFSAITRTAYGGDAAQTYIDTSHSVHYSVGQFINIWFTQSTGGANASSAAITGVTMGILWD